MQQTVSNGVILIEFDPLSPVSRKPYLISLHERPLYYNKIINNPEKCFNSLNTNLNIIVLIMNNHFTTSKKCSFERFRTEFLLNKTASGIEAESNVWPVYNINTRHTFSY